MKHYVIEAVRSTKEDRHLAINLESALLELMDAEKELKWQKYAVYSSQKEYDQIQKKIDEIQTKLVSER
jgi:E3 ubiquitin-protein ligase BRE1